VSGPGYEVTPYHLLVQFDPRDEPRPAEDSPQGEHASPDPGNGVTSSSGPSGAGSPSSRMPTDAGAESPTPGSDVTYPPPPRMPGTPQPPPLSVPPPTPPRMPSPGAPPAWGEPSSGAFPPSGQRAGMAVPDSPPATASAAGPVLAGSSSVPASDEGGPPRSPTEEAGPPAYAGRVEGSEYPAPLPVAPVVASPVERDWLSTICPYLQSEDGSYRSSRPDPGHRCAAQDPPGSLPLAFQERFCLTDRHERCEMYKYAQELTGSDQVTAGQLSGSPDRLTRRSVSLPLGTSAGGAFRRPALVAAAGIGGVFLIVLLVLLMGSCSGGSGTPGGTDDASGAPQASGEPTRAPEPTASPVSEVRQTPEATGGGSVDATEAPQGAQLILYEVQEGEALLKIAETFGVTRRSLLVANPGMEDSRPYVQPGEIIVVPAPLTLTIEELEAIPGFQGLAP
jgi:hypothetical protein